MLPARRSSDDQTRPRVVESWGERSNETVGSKKRLGKTERPRLWAATWHGADWFCTNIGVPETRDRAGGTRTAASLKTAATEVKLPIVDCRDSITPAKGSSRIPRNSRSSALAGPSNVGLLRGPESIEEPR